ncbi:DNA primase [Parvularcula maris]|uniref:DNA primase n=1 Tax=Parvularcula maris TaxID=2965077 RepID=A0A9X2L8B6_9PROT|nr:DNA primase [Parvularcula maris]MCQ8184941.1 DNA primase [Parvularcula maris]
MASYPPDFLDELKSRLRASDVIGRHVPIKKAGREWRGLSPFNKERTPSFYVNDDKQAFFDFSSGQSGDVIKFLMAFQNKTFPEAVEELASLAGMEVPRSTPQEVKRASEQDVLRKVLADAQDFFRKALLAPEGQDARDYLRRRGVGQQAAERFGLGYAPNDWEALKRFFLGRGVEEKVLLRAGLLKVREQDASTYDGFRHRLMFPIHDHRGRVIAFGGRALSSEAKAKYLNSPETEVFHKGRVLYNLTRARERMRGADGQILVCEGYMDALALDSAGFAAVAPLGTALTEEQLRLLWRLTPAPVLCFDGDRAGRAAAERALERALPELSASQSLRFAFLPEGQDPDDLLRKGGKRSMQEILQAKADAEETIWQLALARHGTGTAEQLASVETELKARTNAVKDETFRQALFRAFKDRIYNLRGEQFAARRQRQKTERLRGRHVHARLSPELRSRLGQGGSGGPAGSIREARLVISLIHHPHLFSRFEDEAMSCEFQDGSLARLWSQVIHHLVESPDLDSEGLRSQLSGCSELQTIYERWSRDRTVKTSEFVRHDVAREVVEDEWYDAYTINQRQKHLAEQAIQAAETSSPNERRVSTLVKLGAPMPGRTE